MWGARVERTKLYAADFKSSGLSDSLSPLMRVDRIALSIALSIGFEPIPFSNQAHSQVKILRFALNSQGPQPRALLHKLYLKALEGTCTLIP